MAVDNAASILANNQKGGKKPLDHLDRGSSSPSSYCSCRGKPLDPHGEQDSPPRQIHRRKEDYSLERHHRNHHKGPFIKTRCGEIKIVCLDAERRHHDLVQGAEGSFHQLLERTTR